MDDTTQTEQSVITADWLTSDETMRELGIARRTLQEWASEGFIKYKMQQVAGRRQRVYRAEDVKKVKTNGPPRRKPRPHSPTTPAPFVRAAATHTSKSEQLMLEILKVIREEREGARAERALARVEAKPWLSIEEASAASGLAESFIERAVAEGKIVGVKGGVHGAWRVQRASLEAFAG